jgi:hypothetical protein
VADLRVAQPIIGAAAAAPSAAPLNFLMKVLREPIILPLIMFPLFPPFTFHKASSQPEFRALFHRRLFWLTEIWSSHRS